MLAAILRLARFKLHIEPVKTPNPNFMKFMPEGKIVLGTTGTLDISEQRYIVTVVGIFLMEPAGWHSQLYFRFSSVSPLATELFQIKGVTRVFLGPDYISVAKEDSLEWPEIKSEIQRVISEHYENNKPIVSSEASFNSDDIDPDDSETVQFIKEVLATRIRPNVQDDGGDIKFISFSEETGELQLKMVGACSTCPSSSATLKQGVEKMLLFYIKEVKSVVAVEDCSD